ncbi:TonB-dependent receptor [Rhizobium terrae]|uniref:TonB-dependent receptor n=1 Tax=Rhizobium terrae TaxID=2171756 RepID=UPI001D02319A|nr:TonB-dependent receptor [Rhizobium terrae]
MASTALAIPAFGQTRPDSGFTEATTYSFDIQPMPLKSAMARITAISGWRIFFAGEVPSDIRTQAVSGRHSVANALTQALAGTGLEYRVTGPRSASIVMPGGVGDAGVNDEDSTVLKPIVIKSGRNSSSGSGYQGTPDWVYETPGSVSVVSREAIQNAPSRNARDLLDNVAGVYANRSAGQDPGISVNIRGLQDQNRIVTMIDGARQNFQMAGHGTTSRVYVDTAFVRTIDIEKMGGSGVGGAGNLGGSVDFRTIVADDLIQEGRDWGVELNGTTGTNEFKYDGSLAAAVRLSDSFSILGGYSAKKIGAYEIGEHGDLELNPETTSDNVPIFTGSEVQSSILKAEAQLTDDLDLTVGWLRNNSSFSTGGYIIAGDLAGGTQESISDVVNNTVTANLHWDPDSDLIDLRARFYYNHVENDQEYDQLLVNTLIETPAHYQLATLGGSIDNTSLFDTSLGALTLNYGVEAFHDDGKTSIDVHHINGATGLDDAAGLTGPNPTGTRDVVSVFSTAKLEPTDWLSVTGGLRYDWYEIQGTGSFVGFNTRIHPGSDCAFEPYKSGSWCTSFPGIPFPWTDYTKYDVDIDKSDGALLPSLTVAVQPWDGIQPFVKYAKTFRPPTLMEQLWGGQHYIGSAPTGFAPNVDLTAERADTFEVGVNVSQDGLVSADDKVRLKVVGFHRRVDDYIAFGTIYRDESQRAYTSFVNLDDETTMKGIEVEANYDVGFFYAGASLTYLKTDYADTYTYRGIRGSDPNTGNILHPGDKLSSDTLFVPPDMRVTFDAGVRLFDERLTLGGRATHSSGGKSGDTSAYKVEDYTVYDIYGSWAFSENAKLRFAVNNVADLAYVPSLGTGDLPAPGRTVTASLNFRF